MHVVIKKWGNSASVRLPASVMKSLNLQLDQTVDVRDEGGRIVIEPVRHAVDLAELLAAVTPENLHGEAEFGPVVGKEW